MYGPMLSYSVQELTAAINQTPFQPGLIGTLDLFRPRFLTQAIAAFEVQNNRLALVPSRPRGGPAAVHVDPTRGLVEQPVPHFPYDGTVMADSILGVRQFGAANAPIAFPVAIEERINGMSRQLDVTQEWLRLGAVKGLVITAIDRDTGAVIDSISLFELFGVTPQPTQEWPILAPAGGWQEAAAWTGTVQTLCSAVVRLIATEIGGPPPTIFAVCGSTFFSALVAHPEVRQTYVFSEGAALRERQPYRPVNYGGITFLEYGGQVGAMPFIEADEAHIFPGSVPDLWIEAYAPADYVETVNTVALPRYAKSERMDFDKGVMLQAQMNVLPVNTRPRTLITAKAVQAS